MFTGRQTTYVRGAARLAFEFLVILLGVFGAFRMEEWREARNEAEQAQALVRALASDYAENLAQLDSLIVQQTEVVEAARLLLMVSERQMEPPSPDSIVRLFNLASTQFRFERVRGGYDAVLGSGDLRLLADGELLAEIAAFESDAERDFEDAPESLLHVMVMHEALSSLGSMLLGSRGRNRLNLPPARTPAGVVEPILNEPRFVASLSIRGLLETSRLEQFQRLRDRAARIHDLLVQSAAPS